MSIWLKNLNPEQTEAVLHDRGPLLILAGAGSGKTTVLVSRTARLIADRLTAPERICVLTFTNKAANELKMRVSKVPGANAEKVWAGTFHGFGLRFLKEHWQEAGLPKKFGVIDGNDQQAIVKDLLRDHKALEKEAFKVETLMSLMAQLRLSGKKTLSLDGSIESTMAEVLTPKYTQRLRQLGVVDFEDLLLKPLRMMRENEELQKKLQGRYDFVPRAPTPHKCCWLTNSLNRIATLRWSETMTNRFMDGAALRSATFWTFRSATNNAKLYASSATTVRRLRFYPWPMPSLPPTKIVTPRF